MCFQTCSMWTHVGIDRRRLGQVDPLRRQDTLFEPSCSYNDTVFNYFKVRCLYSWGGSLICHTDNPASAQREQYLTNCFALALVDTSPFPLAASSYTCRRLPRRACTYVSPRPHILCVRLRQFLRKKSALQMGQRYRLFRESELHVGLCLQNQHQEVHQENIWSMKAPNHHMGVFILTYTTWQNFSDICSTFVLMKALTAITYQIESVCDGLF